MTLIRTMIPRQIYLWILPFLFQIDDPTRLRSRSIKLRWEAQHWLQNYQLQARADTCQNIFFICWRCRHRPLLDGYILQHHTYGKWSYVKSDCLAKKGQKNKNLCCAILHTCWRGSRLPKCGKVATHLWLTPALPHQEVWKQSKLVVSSLCVLRERVLNPHCRGSDGWQPKRWGARRRDRGLSCPSGPGQQPWEWSRPRGILRLHCGHRKDPAWSGKKQIKINDDTVANRMQK